MQLVDLPVGEPGPGEIRIRHHACGLNFIDVYQRTGLYANPLPLTLGMEGAVSSRRWARASPPGVPATAPPTPATRPAATAKRVMPAANVVRLPDDIASTPPPP
jgi:NADPH2:quinone reductase